MMERVFVAAVVGVLGAASSAQPPDAVVLRDLDDSFTPAGGFAFGSFAGNTVEDADSLSVDATGFGGIGLARFADPASFPWRDYAVRINAALLPGNAVTELRLALADVDGDDSGPTEGIEVWEFSVPLGGLTTGSFTEVTVPLYDPAPLPANPAGPVFRSKLGSASFDGDGLLNFGLGQWVLQTLFSETGRLAIDIDRIELVRIGGATPSIGVIDSGFFDPGFGFTYDSFIGNVSAGPGVLAIDATGFGGVGYNIGSVVDFETDGFDVAVLVRELPGNAQDTLRLVLRDSDGGSDFTRYEVDADISGITTDGFTEVVFDTSAAAEVADNNGDGSANYGLDQWQLQNPFGATERLAIEVGAVRLVPITPEPIVLEEFDGGVTGEPGWFDFGAFDMNVTDTSGSIVVDGTGFGGFGNSVPLTEFDEGAYQLSITFELLPGNGVTDRIQLLLSDEDPGGREDHVYNILLAGVGVGEETTITRPLPEAFGFTLSTKDGAKNFGLSRWAIQTRGANTNRLHIEITGLRLEPVETSLLLSDFDPFGGTTSGTFVGGGATFSGGAVTIDVSGFGFLQGDFFPQPDFDERESGLRIVGRRLAGNAAEKLRFVIVDRDGDDLSPGSGDERYVYELPTSALPDGATAEEVIVPLFEAGPYVRGSGGTFFDGDAEINPDLLIWQLQSDNASSDRLAVEIEELSIVSLPEDEVPPPAGCSAADLGEPFGELDFFDYAAFFTLFGAGDDRADLAAPAGVFDVFDVQAFDAAFGAGCP